MSTSLPQEVQTNKVKTLPDDLKAIAEEMLAYKFGVKEVVTERDDTFLHPADPRRFRQEYADGINPFADESFMGDKRFNRGFDRVYARFDMATGDRIAEVFISRPDSRTIHDAVNAVSREAGRHVNMTLLAPRGFVRVLLRDPESMMFFNPNEGRGGPYRTIGTMFGCSVAIVEDGLYPRVEARF